MVSATPSAKRRDWRPPPAAIVILGSRPDDPSRTLCGGRVYELVLGEAVQK